MPLLIIIIGMVLIGVNYYAITKDKKTFLNVLKDQDDYHKDYDVELFAIRKDMAESILDLQKEIIELKGYIDSKTDIKKDTDIDDIIMEVEKEPAVISNINYQNKIEQVEKESKDNKVEKIKEMIKLGYSDEEICDVLKIGKGEVLLIKGLFN